VLGGAARVRRVGLAQALALARVGRGEETRADFLEHGHRLVNRKS
jgi:hypothetical protein